MVYRSAHKALGALLFLLVSLVIGAAVSRAEEGAPSYEHVKATYRASDILVLDRHNEVIQRVRENFYERKGDWLPLEEISPALVRAVLLAEDRRFHVHHGVDWLALGSAVWGRVTGETRGGASTISMQVADLIEGRSGSGHGRDLAQKLGQMRRAWQLEANWTKPQILEAYLNLAPWRGELVGVDALSRVLFGKHASGLNRRESALAAVMLRSPNAPALRLQQRACVLVHAMGAAHECKSLTGFIENVLARRGYALVDSPGLAPHFARWILAPWQSASDFQRTDTEKPQSTRAGERLVTSLDGRLQRYARDALDRHIRQLEAQNVRDGAVIVLDNATGQILAYVGSSGKLSQSALVDHAQALRQAGSTLKPFLYQQALEQHRLTPVSLLLDAALDLDTGSGMYVPRNYNEDFAGWVSARTALASSLNVPAVRVLTMVGPDAFAQKLLDLGLPLSRRGDFYGYSLALGSAEVSLLSLTNAYRVLANLGAYSHPTGYMHEAVQASQAARILSPDAAWIVGDILSDAHARSRTFGLDSPLATPFWTAVKTGTSKDMRDNWALGWSARFTVGVWVGNSQGDAMRQVSGVSGAGPVWHDIMMFLHRDHPGSSYQLPPPDGVVKQGVVFDNGLEAPRLEYFMSGTEQKRVRMAAQLHVSGRAWRIVQPVDGTIIALDPDIPPAHQRLSFIASHSGEAVPATIWWRLGGTRIADQPIANWFPLPGRHRIELVDESGAVLDSVRIVVRAPVGRADEGVAGYLD